MGQFPAIVRKSEHLVQFQEKRRRSEACHVAQEGRHRERDQQVRQGGTAESVERQEVPVDVWHACTELLDVSAGVEVTVKWHEGV